MVVRVCVRVHIPEECDGIYKPVPIQPGGAGALCRGRGSHRFPAELLPPYAADTVQGCVRSRKKGLASSSAPRCTVAVPGGGSSAKQSVGVAFLRPTVTVVKANKPPPTRHAPMHGHGGDWR